MSNRVNLARNVTAFDESPSFLPYGKVIIHQPNDADVTATLPNYSESTHRTFEYESPLDGCTYSDAYYILQAIGGYAYKPFSASGALLDPAAQLGDVVSCNGISSILGRIDTNFDTLCAADVSAPQSEEINHEFNYETKDERDLESGLSNKLTNGMFYGGASLGDNNGFMAVSSGGATVTINSSELSFSYNGQRVLYFDPIGRKYIFNGDIIIQSGSISFSDLDYSAQARTDNNAIANGTYSGGTFISGTTIYSPTIYANTFTVRPQNLYNSSGGFELYGGYNSRNYLFFKTEYDGYGFPAVNLYSPDGATLRIGYNPSPTQPHNTVYLYGTVHLMDGTRDGILYIDSNGYVRAQ